MDLNQSGRLLNDHCRPTILIKILKYPVNIVHDLRVASAAVDRLLLLTQAQVV